MNRNDVAKASKKIGLTDSQEENLWQALQEVQKNKSKFNLSTVLTYIGSLLAFLSMTWFYVAHLESSSALLVSIAYGIIFFGTGAYLWYVKKLRVPGGLLFSLGIVMIPLIVYSLQNSLHWGTTPTLEGYRGFYRWINGEWVPMEICTLVVASVVLYFIRFPFITVPIYFALTFMLMDAIDLFANPENYRWEHCIAAMVGGMLLIALGFGLYKREQKDFGFWSYLFGMFLFWGGITGLNIQTEWGNFIYLLINLAILFIANFFHRKIFMFFGSLGAVCYLTHLTIIFSDSLMLSYILAAIGFSIIVIATLFKKSAKLAEKS